MQHTVYLHFKTANISGRIKFFYCSKWPYFDRARARIESNVLKINTKIFIFMKWKQCFSLTWRLLEFMQTHIWILNYWSFFYDREMLSGSNMQTGFRPSTGREHNIEAGIGDTCGSDWAGIVDPNTIEIQNDTIKRSKISVNCELLFWLKFIY